MRNIKAVFVILISIAILSMCTTRRVDAQEAELAVINQTLIRDGEIFPRLIFDGWMYSKSHEGLGLWGVSWTEKDFTAILGGPFLSFPFGSDEEGLFEFGVAAGAETFKGDNGKFEIYSRYAAFVALDYKKFSAEVNYENGSSHYGWIRLEADIHLWENNSLGMYHQKGDGWGPRVSHLSSRWPIRAWVAPMYLHGEWGVLTGFEVLLQKP